MKLLLIILFFPLLTIAQTNWVSQKLDNNLSIKFPITPEKTTKNGTDVYIAKEKDSVMYSVGVMDLKNIIHLDSAALLPLKDTRTFAEGFMKGMAAQKQNYTFGDVSIEKWKTFTSYRILGTDKTTKANLFVQMIIIGSKLYALSCRVPENITTKKNEFFFSSAALYN